MKFDSFDKMNEAFGNNKEGNGVQFNVKRPHLISIIIMILIIIFTIFAWQPIFSLQSSSTAFYLIFMVAIFVVIDAILSHSFKKFHQSALIVAGIGLIAVIGLSAYSGPLFQANKYHKQLDITETDKFSENFKTMSFDQIPIIDLEVSKQLGDKKMGQVTALGSQFNVSDEYTLVNVKDKLYRVSPLEYQDIFKWFQNREAGIPGYIKVNVTDPNDVELVELEEGIKYSPSAPLLNNLKRIVYLKYPTALTTDYSFEIDDEGNPFWVVSTYTPTIGLYGGNDSNGAIIVDAQSGEMNKYNVDDLPEWVDRMQPAETALEQLNNWGKYVNGFFNTVIGQKNMLTATPDFNFMTIDGQANVFTGVTSVGADRSIVGFATINLKTKKAMFYKVNGADEASAMASAEGAVQAYGYKSTFPLILNIAQRPTYFMSLKDQEGLVKNYSFVSLENYNIVGVGASVKEAQDAYIEQLSKNGEVLDSSIIDEQSVEGKITRIQSAIKDNNSMYYFTIEGSDKMFMAPLKLSTELVLSSVGDVVKISYAAQEDKNVLVESFDNILLAY